jgi:hypothetical protein
MKRTLMVGLFACCIVVMQGQSLLLAQDTSAGGTSGSVQAPQWETVRGLSGDIQILRVWALESKFQKSQIALAIVTDADFQQFVQHPEKLVGFLRDHKVFPDDKKNIPVSEITHWASLMSPTYTGDPDQWLLTIVHGTPCRGAVTSQPFVP